MPTVPTEVFPFCQQTYPAVSTLLDSQRAINLYPETALPSSKSRVALIGTPGLTAFATIAPPVRALWAGNSRLFAVGGANVDEITSGGGVINLGSMAGSTGSGPAQIVQGVGPSFQLDIMDLGAQTIYSMNSGSPVAVFEGVALEYLDGFFVAVAKPTATVQNRIQISDSAGLVWDPLLFANRTGAQDLVIQLAVTNGQLWIFGEKTIEVWYNAGNPGFPFARIQGATINQGLLARFSVAKIENRLMWLGADEAGWPVVFQTAGLLPVRVSNFAIENLIASYGTNIYTARAYTYREAGHLFYVLNFVGGTVVYDVNTGMWHERAWLSGDTLARARGNCCSSVGIFPDKTQVFVGDWENGNVYVQRLDIPSDIGVPIRRIRTSPHLSSSNRWAVYPSLEIDADIGTAQIGLEFSNDGGRTFPASIAPQGASNDLSVDGFGRYKWYQLGRSRDRVFRTTITDSTNLIRLINAYLDVIPGTEP